MGKLKEDVFNLIKNFSAENKNKDRKVFIHNLQELINTLTLILNKNFDIPITKDMIIIHTDASSMGNPGKSGIGILIKDHLNNIILKESRDIGIRTNNQAEYIAIAEALKISLEKKFKQVILYSDSEVVIKQINGIYRVKDAALKMLYEEIKSLESRFDTIKFIHIRREKNKEADILSR